MADILTRREAKTLSKFNRGYNGEQFRYAMQNAKTALRNGSDLKGKELRQQARRIVAGPIEKPVLTETSAPALNVPQITLAAPRELAPLPTRRETSVPSTDFTFMGSFGKAFNAAFNSGAKTFIWNGKTYSTRRDSNWRERWNLNNPTGGTNNSASPAVQKTSNQNSAQSTQIPVATRANPNVNTAITSTKRYNGYSGQTEAMNPYNPRTDYENYTKYIMGRWRYILDHPDSYNPREIQYSRENLPKYESAHPDW